MFIPCVAEEKNDFRGFTLILPAIAVGNVGQLAVDLLLCNHPMTKVGYLYDSCILPVVGNDPFSASDKGELATSAEVYKCEEKKLVVIQQRAPIKKGCRQIYSDKMIEWIQQCQFAQTVLLTSCLASERVDSQIQSGPFRYVLSSSAKHLTDHFQTELGWKCLEQRESVSEKSCDIFLPGGGVSKMFYKKCCQKEVPLVMLLVFCAEGDNIPDAKTILHFMNCWLKILKFNKDEPSLESQTVSHNFLDPPSWKNLYGTKHFALLF